ncbi:MAG TPA: YciI family protein [Saprospiraceae bacterium]|nr:YciI family protein [Saprospiraceae bacterium]
MVRMGICLSLFLLVLACGQAPSSQLEEAEASSEALRYDSLKAVQLGADDYGMKTYVMAFLKKGANRDIPTKEAAELQAAHLENITRLAEEGKLILAGPFLGKGELRGIYIFDTPSIEEAEALTATDPAIEAGSLAMDLRQWYGSAALSELNAIHETIQKVGITE